MVSGVPAVDQPLGSGHGGRLTGSRRPPAVRRGGVMPVFTPCTVTREVRVDPPQRGQPGHAFSPGGLLLLLGDVLLSYAPEQLVSIKNGSLYNTRHGISTFRVSRFTLDDCCVSTAGTQQLHDYLLDARDRLHADVVEAFCMAVGL